MPDQSRRARRLPALALAVAVLAAAPVPSLGAPPSPPVVLVPVEGVVLPLLDAARHRPTGAVRVDFSIEAARPEDAALIQALMPRVRDALLTRLGPLSAAGYDITPLQLEETRRRILALVRQSVGEASVAAIHFRRVFAHPT